MRKLIVCGVGLVAALALTVPGAFGGAAQTPGVTGKVDHHRRDVPAHRACGVVCADPARDEGLLQLRQRSASVQGRGSGKAAGRARPPDRLEVLRRRLQPREHRPAFAEARRAGQGLRDRRPARNRARSRRSCVFEPAEGAAGPRLDGSVVLGPSGQGVPMDDRLAARLHRRGPSLRDPPQGELPRARRSRSSTRTTITGRTISTASLRRSASSTPMPTSSPARQSRRLPRPWRRI